MAVLTSSYERQPVTWTASNTVCATTANAITFDVPAGVTICGSTFATAGTYTVSATYTTD